MLRIKRLTDLGLSLAQIGELGEADEHPEEALRALDAELAGTIERLQRVRAELGVILRQAAPTDLPPGLAKAVVDAELSPADRSFAVVLAQVLAPATLTRYAESLHGYAQDPVIVEFDGLAADADEETRQDLAERMRGAPAVLRMRALFPQGVYADAPRGEAYAMETAGPCPFPRPS